LVPAKRKTPSGLSARAKGEVTSSTLVLVTLFVDLYAFVQAHRRSGELDAAVEGDRVWMTCTCGAAIRRDVSAPWSASAP
jgi:hypothetical protein